MYNSSLVRTVAAAFICAFCGTPTTLRGDDQVFSGPQPGEKTPPFKVADLTGTADGKERDLITENKGMPTVLVFLHGLERSLVPLLTTIDQYGVEHKDGLRTEIIFLAADRLSGEQRLKAAANSLRLQSRWGISLDGAEGPGNYGLNKECLMTIVVANENKVTANFALVQPGIADAPKVIKALARVSGDTTPPAVEALQARRQAQTRRGDRNAMAADSSATRREKAAANATPDKPKEEYPGKPPTDAKLMGLLRRFIQPVNDDASVDRVLAEVDQYVKPDPELLQQAIDGWTRVLYFKDRYGTAYARKQGKAALDKWKQQK